jgi:hypothetical protein
MEGCGDAGLVWAKLEVFVEQGRWRDGVMAEEAGRGCRDLLTPFADDVGRASGRCMQMPVLNVQISKLIARRGAGDIEIDNAGSSW